MRALLISKTSDSELASSVARLIATLGFETDQTDVIEERGADLAVVIIDRDQEHFIHAIRAEMPEVPVVAIVDAEMRSAAIAAGADDALDRHSTALASLSRAIRWACDRRALETIEHHLLEVMDDYGESLAVGGPDEIAERAVANIMDRVGAESGMLAFEWEWKGITESVTHTRNLEDRDLEAYLEDPLLSPLHSAPGIHELEANDEHPFRSALVVEVAHRSSWGRGGIAVFSREIEAFSQLDRHLAATMAGWAGVAFRHASSLRELERAVRVRERVLAVASHDLRTPLSVFSMTTELMAETDDHDERIALRDRAIRSVDTMRRLTNDILDFAAIDSGKLRIQRTRVRASTLAARAVEQSRLGSRKQAAPISVELDDDVEIEVDAGRIVQALTNLLDNALKFTPASGEIRVSLSHNDNTCTFSVADNGPGIPVAQQRQLFRRYESTSAAKQGVGLGLSIAKGIAEAHGGSIFVESSEGEGATFRLAIPRTSVSK